MPTTRKTSPRTTRTKTSLIPFEDSALEKAYEAFVRGLELVGLGLKECAANIDRDAFFECLQKEKELTQEYVAEYKVAEYNKKHFDCEGKFEVIVTNTKNQSLLTVHCVFNVHMHSKQEVDQKFVERFSQSELKLILAPYARNFVTDITARMAVPPVVIPLASRR